MIESDLAEFSCPLPENKAREFFGVDVISRPMLEISRALSRSVGAAARKVKSSEDLSYLKDMIHQIFDQNRSFRDQYLLNLKQVGADQERSELPEMMSILLTKSQEPLEPINETVRQIQKDLKDFPEIEKVILKNFTIRLTSNWLERIKEKQKEVRQGEDLVESFNIMTLEGLVVPSNSVKRVYFAGEEVSRLVDKDKEESQSQKKTKTGSFLG